MGVCVYVWVCVCVGVWVCGCVCVGVWVWVCGCVGVGVCGCVGVCVGVCVCGCVGVWVCGCGCVCVGVCVCVWSVDCCFSCLGPVAVSPGIFSWNTMNEKGEEGGDDTSLSSSPVKGTLLKSLKVFIPAAKSFSICRVQENFIFAPPPLPGLSTLSDDRWGKNHRADHAPFVTKPDFSPSFFANVGNKKTVAIFSRKTRLTDSPAFDAIWAGFLAPVSTMAFWRCFLKVFVFVAMVSEFDVWVSGTVINLVTVTNAENPRYGLIATGPAYDVAIARAIQRFPDALNGLNVIRRVQVITPGVAPCDDSGATISITAGQMSRALSELEGFTVLLCPRTSSRSDLHFFEQKLFYIKSFFLSIL